MRVPATSHQERHLGAYNKVIQPSLSVFSKDIIQKNGSPSMLCLLGALLGLVAMGSWLLSLLSP